ncbi:ParB/RepB/Spo0J family partition protein [Paraburkholderia dipogonis]|jgi:ParB family chromosome partitioning protein|uniref:ParB/RepB/Spo0J family partition protein n=1 Tax=Paraburkholderia dipogonis TaxID=1211383 RepID=UPI0038BA8959
MSKSLKALLAQKAEENTQRHREANYRDDFDVGRQHTKLPLDRIDPNPYQPRTSFPEEEIRELAVSISAVGLLQPISVRAVGERYELIAGERRLRAHKLLTRPTIEALVISADEATSATLALAENIEREDLSDFEIGESIKRLEEHFPKRTKLAESLGIQRSDLYRYLSFASLPDSIRKRLAARPKLLSRSAAADIVRVLKEAGDDESISRKLEEAWALLESGKLDQTKLASFLCNSATTTAGTRQRPTHIMKQGAKVGTFSQTPHEFVMKVANNVLTDDQKLKIQQFVLELLA